MIERLYVSNYRCLENFTLDLVGRESALMIGKNGSGKSTVRHALGVFQKICRGPNRAEDWIDESDFAQNRTHIPIRFELDVKISHHKVKYAVSFELIKESREACIAEEIFTIDGTPFFSRIGDQITMNGGPPFGIDLRFAALPVIRGQTALDDAIEQFKIFCRSMIIIAPIPLQMLGFSAKESVELEDHATNFADWLITLLRRKPESYGYVLAYLQEIMPDLASFENAPRGEKASQLYVTFKKEGVNPSPPIEFNRLSDGEKCFFLSALILAANRLHGPRFCFWDEPDSHLSLSEIDHFILHLRKMTNFQGQFLAASHHPQVIRCFSDDNTIVLTRKSHLEPTVIRLLSESEYEGDLIDALLLDEVIG